jgi:hypothetical protein
MRDSDDCRHDPERRFRVRIVPQRFKDNESASAKLNRIPEVMMARIVLRFGSNGTSTRLNDE